MSGDSVVIAGEEPRWTGRTRNQRIAFVTGVVSAANMAFTFALSLGIILFNANAYWMINGKPIPRLSGLNRVAPYEWRGYMLIEVPWWAFAVNAVVLFAVVMVSRSPSRRFTPRPVAGWPPWLSTAPWFLVIVSVSTAALQLWSTLHMDGLLSILSPYWIGPLVCTIAALVAIRRRGRETPSPLQERPHPLPVSSRRSFVAALVLCVNIGTFALIWGGGILVSQIFYLASHGGRLPVVATPHMKPSDVWWDFQLIPLPWWILMLNAAILLGVLFYIVPLKNRFHPAGNRRLSLLTTSPLILTVWAILLFFTQIFILVFYPNPEGARLDLIGLGICLATIGIGLVFWWWGPGSEELRAANRKPKRLRHPVE